MGEGASITALEVVTAAAGMLTGVTGVCVSIVALRLSREQARGYLFPAPAVYADVDGRYLAIRNFGPGAMLNMWAEITLHRPAQSPEVAARVLPSLAQGERATLVEAEVFRNVPLLAVEVELHYETILRKPKIYQVKLTADQLITLGS